MHSAVMQTEWSSNGGAWRCYENTKKSSRKRLAAAFLFHLFIIFGGAGSLLLCVGFL